MGKNVKIILIIIAIIVTAFTLFGIFIFAINIQEPVVDVKIDEVNEIVEQIEEVELYPYETFDMKTFLNFQPNTVYVYENQANNELFKMYFSKMEDEKLVVFLENNDTYVRQEAYTTVDELVMQNLIASYDLRSMLLGIYAEPITDVSRDVTSETVTMLKAPFVVGNTWVSRGSTFEIEEVSKDYIIVNGTTLDGVKNKVYYKEGLGIYKFIEYIDGEEQVYELLEVLDKVPTITSKFSYIDANLLERTYVDVEVALHTNDLVVDVINELYSNVPDGFMSPLPEGTSILSIEMNEGDDFVHVDFSEEFQTNRNFGSGLELESLASIADTFGELYNVDKVKITIAGNSYESGHISLSDDMITR